MEILITLATLNHPKLLPIQKENKIKVKYSKKYLRQNIFLLSDMWEKAMRDYYTKAERKKEIEETDVRQRIE